VIIDEDNPGRLKWSHQTGGFVDDVGGSGTCDEGDGCCSLARRSDWEGDVELGEGCRVGFGVGEFAVIQSPQ